MSLCNRSFKVLFRPKASPIQHTVNHSLEKLHSPNPVSYNARKGKSTDSGPLQYCRLSRGRQASPCESKCHHISFVTDPLGASDCDPGPSGPREEEHKCNLRGPPTSVLKAEMLSCLASTLHLFQKLRWKAEQTVAVKSG